MRSARRSHVARTGTPFNRSRRTAFRPRRFFFSPAVAAGSRLGTRRRWLRKLWGHWLPRRHQRQHSEPFVVGVDALDETVALDPAGDVSPLVVVDLAGVDVSLGGLDGDQALFRCLDAPASAGLLLPRQQIAGKATCPMDDLPFACVVPPARAGRSRSRRVVPGRSGPKEGERFRPESVIGFGLVSVIGWAGVSDRFGAEDAMPSRWRRPALTPNPSVPRPAPPTSHALRGASEERSPRASSPLIEVGTPYREAPRASHSSNLSCIAHEERGRLTAKPCLECNA